MNWIHGLGVGLLAVGLTLPLLAQDGSGGGPPAPAGRGGPADGPAGRGNPPDAGRGGTVGRVEGIVGSSNYEARGGTVNGVVLENGDFVHLNGRDAQTLDLKPGQKVVVEGRIRPMQQGGHNIIEAQSVNGQTVADPQEGPGGRGPDGRGPDGRGPDGGPGGRGPGGPGGPGRGGPGGPTANPTGTAPSTMPLRNVSAGGVVTWVHIGDLHMTTADQQNFTDLKTIITQINENFKAADFVLLPGDNADNGAESQYQIIKDALGNLKVPLYAIPGDHDLKDGTTLFERYVYPKSYYSKDIGGYHFAFLNVMDRTTGLRAGTEQSTWLAQDLDKAAGPGKAAVIVMHPHYHNEVGDAATFRNLIERDNVILVDSGHTHTNELANDGRVIYSATRSTGQAREGSVGFSVVTLDHGVASWKFRELASSYPFVMINSPADERMIIASDQVVHGQVTISARGYDSQSLVSASYQMDGGAPVKMEAGPNSLFTGHWDSSKSADGSHKIVVAMKDAGGHEGSDAITVLIQQNGSYQPARKPFGPEGNTIGPDAIKGLLHAKN